MLYNYLKILHIFSAGVILSSILYSCKLWWQTTEGHNLERIQTQTWLVIIPFALFQLGTGFTLISLNPDALLPFYIKGSVLAFLTTMISWMLFTYFVLSTQRKIGQKISLLVCISSILCMIYFMASRL